ncbi:MAG: hypothetical protein LUC99_04590, partial [Clostridiales bacterium]|nr:hypothetical protein [Clostridiales bacterium]
QKNSYLGLAAALAAWYNVFRQTGAIIYAINHFSCYNHTAGRATWYFIATFDAKFCIFFYIGFADWTQQWFPIPS